MSTWLVSIRPQFANRRKRKITELNKLIQLEFQSAPSSQTGGNSVGSEPDLSINLFQSAPSSQTGGNGLLLVVIPAFLLFQSAPSSQTGGNATIQLSATGTIVFQSAPSSQTGGNVPLHSRIAIGIVFQSAPSSQTGGNVSTTGIYEGSMPVSIRPQFANRRKLLFAVDEILSHVSFNPPPVRKPEETIRDLGQNGRNLVSIRPQFANRRKRLAFRGQDRTPEFQSAPSSQTGGNSR